MDHPGVLFFITLICLTIVSVVECDNLSTESRTEIVDSKSSIELQSPIDNLLKRFHELFGSTNPDTQKSFQTSENENNLGNQRSNRQLLTVPTLPPFLETIRSYFKTAYKTYLLLNAEVKFGQCLVKYLYIRFPNTVRFFQLQNLTKYARRVYIAMGKMISNFFKNGNIFDWYDDSEFDRKRIALKVATLTSERVFPDTTSAQSVNPFEAFRVSRSDLTNYTNLRRSSTPREKKRLIRRVGRQTGNFNPRSEKLSGNSMQVKKSNVMPSNQKQMTSDHADIDSEARIDLSNKVLEREAENLFNIDLMFWKSLGIEENSFAKYSLAYCTKEYVTDSFKRFMKNVIFS